LTPIGIAPGDSTLSTLPAVFIALFFLVWTDRRAVVAIEVAARDRRARNDPAPDRELASGMGARSQGRLVWRRLSNALSGGASARKEVI